MNQRLINGVIGAIAVAGIACVDMSAPKGPASISTLLLPSPSVVVGDVMRDSTGAPAPLMVVAYDAEGSPIPGLTSSFFLTDSIRYAHLDANDELVGDSLGVAHVVGQIGSLQTDIATVPVTSAPDTFAVTLVPGTLMTTLGADSASSLGTAALGVNLKSATQLPATGFIVKYVLVTGPASSTQSLSPAVFIVGDDGKASLVDTTDGSGNASRTLVVNARQLADDSLLIGAKTDSAVVQAYVTYKGMPVKGSPITFIVRIKVE